MFQAGLTLEYGRPDQPSRICQIFLGSVSIVPLHRLNQWSPKKYPLYEDGRLWEHRECDFGHTCLLFKFVTLRAQQPLFTKLPVKAPLPTKYQVSNRTNYVAELQYDLETGEVKAAI